MNKKDDENNFKQNIKDLNKTLDELAFIRKFFFTVVFLFSIYFLLTI